MLGRSNERSVPVLLDFFVAPNMRSFLSAAAVAVFSGHVAIAQLVGANNGTMPTSQFMTVGAMSSVTLSTC